MDEYTMAWSDAARVEAAALGAAPSPLRSIASTEFGTLGKALWAERCLARLFALGPGVDARAARALVCDLGASRSWLQVEPEEVASMILQSTTLQS